MKSETVKKRKYSVLLMALLLLLVIYFVATLIGLRTDIKAQAAENERISEQIEAQSAENEELEALINSDDKNAYIEHRARADYDYADPDERVYHDAVD